MTGCEKRYRTVRLGSVRLAMALMSLVSFAACQSHTETYGGERRKVEAPPTKDVTQAMAVTKSRANDDMQAVLDEFQQLGPKPIESLSAQDARDQPTPAEAVVEVLEEQDRGAEPQAVARVENRTIPGPGGKLPVRIYYPYGQGPFPIVVYYHGGGWVIGTVDTYDASARALCRAADAIIFSVEYRKAPEHKFPAAHEDAFAAYQWVSRHAESIGGDPSLVAVAGESAGGNLAGAVPLMARARNERMPVHQVLIYPVTGSDMNTPSYRDNEQAKPLNKAMMAWFFEKYLKDPADGKSPWINLVGNEDLKGLPPATIITAEIDPLQSEGRRYAERLREAGVPVTYRNFEGVTHEFFGMGAVVRDAKQAVRVVGRDLDRSFEQAAVEESDDRRMRRPRAADSQKQSEDRIVIR